VVRVRATRRVGVLGLRPNYPVASAAPTLVQVVAAALCCLVGMFSIACSSEGDNEPTVVEAPLEKKPTDTGQRSTDPSKDGTTSTTPTPSNGCSKGAGGNKLGRSLDVHGQERSYDLLVPSSYDKARSYPLVFVFHGGGGTSADARHTLDFSKVAKNDAIFVYPTARDGNWDLDTPADHNADVAFFDALVALVEESHCVDRARVFATGYSNGGYFSNQLGCRRGDVLRGIAPHAGGGPFEGDDGYDDNGNLKCKGKAVAAMVFHGERDEEVSIDEGHRSLSHWKWANGCEDNSSGTSPDPCVSFAGCKNPVVFCGVPELGHDVWSEGTRSTWSFFSKL
jgi:polyhydroxybutyrate depolymerase